MNYRYYRLYESTMLLNAVHLRKLREYEITFQEMSESANVSTENPNNGFRLLHQVCPLSRLAPVSEACAFPTLLERQSEQAERQLWSTRNAARSGGANSSLRIVFHFLCEYATAAAICDAINDLPNIRLKAREHEPAYGERINVAARRCGSFYDEVDKLTLFVDGLSLSTQTAVIRFQESGNQRNLSYEERVLYSKSDRASHPVRLHCFSMLQMLREGKKLISYFI